MTDTAAARAVGQGSGLCAHPAWRDVLLCPALWLALLLVLWAFPVQAALVLDEAQLAYPAAHSESAYLCAPEAELSPESVLANPDAYLWQPAGTRIPNFGFTRDICWFRLPIHNTGTDEQRWLLQLGSALVSEVDFYLRHPDGRVTDTARAGHALRYDVRPYPYQLPTFPLSIPVGAQAEAFVRISTTYSMQAPIAVLERSEMERRAQNTLLLQGLFFGSLLVMMLYNLFLYISIREKAYLLYVAWSFTITLFLAVLHGFAQRYLWPGTPLLSTYGTLYLLPLIVILPPLFTIHFLELPQRAPLLYRVLRFHVGIGIALLLLTPFISRDIMVPMAVFAILAMDLAILVVGILRTRAGDLDARIFTFAWICFLIGTATMSISKLGWVPRNNFTEYLIQVGVFIEVVLLSFALAYRINRLKTEHSGAARERALAEMEVFKAGARNQAKSEFLATMSHEIRTPMNGVLGMTDLLKRTPMSNQQSQYVDTIHEATRSLLTVINDILDYSRIEAGKLELENVEVRIEDLVDDCVSLFALHASERNIPVYTYLDSRVPAVIHTDPVRVKQIITNLLSNAFKFTEHGQIALHVALRQPPDANGRCLLQFEVSDTGSGLNDAQQRMLFRDFSEPDTAPSPQRRGAGLGLTISQRLCQLMGGEIGVNSSPGRGATFWFTVQSRCANVSAIVPALLRKRLLVVDPEPSFCLSVSQMAARWGMDVEDCRDIAGASERLSRATGQAPFDAMLVNRRLREDLAQLPEATRPRILLLAGAAGEAAGDDLTLDAPLINTPIRARNLRDLLIRYLSRSSRNPQPGKGSADSARQRPAEQDELSQLNVLVAEDNAVNQLVIDSILKTAGIRATLVNNGQEALAAFKGNRRHWHIVFMDCEMPVMDGYQATREIRALEQGAPQDGQDRRSWIIALSAHASGDHIQQARDAGVDDYLSKPVSRDQVIDAILRSTRRQNTAGSA
ncbi:MAG: response regulator [Alcanivorax sp.]|nr:response regulator [Alcanivorax sp.]